MTALLWRERQPATLSSHPDESSKTVMQPVGKCKAKEPNGLEVHQAATFRAWV